MERMIHGTLPLIPWPFHDDGRRQTAIMEAFTRRHPFASIYDFAAFEIRRALCRPFSASELRKATDA